MENRDPVVKNPMTGKKNHKNFKATLYNNIMPFFLLLLFFGVFLIMYIKFFSILFLLSQRLILIEHFYIIYVSTLFLTNENIF